MDRTHGVVCTCLSGAVACRCHVPRAACSVWRHMGVSGGRGMPRVFSRPLTRTSTHALLNTSAYSVSSALMVLSGQAVNGNQVVLASQFDLRFVSLLCPPAKVSKHKGRLDAVGHALIKLLRDHTARKTGAPRPTNMQVCAVG